VTAPVLDLCFQISNILILGNGNTTKGISFNEVPEHVISHRKIEGNLGEWLEWPDRDRWQQNQTA
jgi:hypothetical protein